MGLLACLRQLKSQSGREHRFVDTGCQVGVEIKPAGMWQRGEAERRDREEREKVCAVFRVWGIHIIFKQRDTLS